MAEQDCHPAQDFGLLTVDDIGEMDPFGRQVLDDYVRGFLAKPHPDLRAPDEPNRSVCPFIPGALAKKTIYLTVLRGLVERNEIQGAVDHYRAAFRSINPCTGETTSYKAVLLIFPDVTDPRAVIDDVQTRLKPSFVAEGLMIGEFHSLCDTSGVYNKDFRPMHSPVPMLAIREMVPEDRAFLIGPSIPPEYSALFARSWLKAFLKWNPEELGTRRARNTLAGLQMVVRLLGIDNEDG